MAKQKLTANGLLFRQNGERRFREKIKYSDENEIWNSKADLIWQELSNGWSLQLNHLANVAEYIKGVKSIMVKPLGKEIDFFTDIT